VSDVKVALAPEPEGWAVQAVTDGGGRLVGLDEDPDALVWTVGSDWAGLADALAAAPRVRWVQLPFAGVEGVRSTGVLTEDRAWTCAKGVYGETVAEHALALALAGLRSLPERARARSWGAQGAATLYDATVVVVGAGGITSALMGLLAPFRCRVVVVRRDGDRPVEGAARTVGTDRLDEVLPEALVVFLTLALTEETRHVIGAGQLARMREDAWLVNVARGGHVDQDALVEALRDGRIGGAALDVTDPEPLPDDSPLWQLGRCLVTPHTANPWATAQGLLASRVRDNVRRFAAGEPLEGVVDVAAGY